jgi:hypothetical protein
MSHRNPIWMSPVRLPRPGFPKKVYVDIITCPKTNKLIDRVSDEHKNCPHYDASLVLHDDCKRKAKDADRLAGKKGRE